MSSPAALENLVERGLEFFHRSLYVVLDGLNECDHRACRGIIAFFNRLFQHQTSHGLRWIKVLVSARAQDPTRQLLEACDSVNSFLSRQSEERLKRDLIIARRRIELELGSTLTQDMKDWLAREIALRSE